VLSCRQHTPGRRCCQTPPLEQPPPATASSADTVTAGDTSSYDEDCQRHSSLTPRLDRIYTYGVTISVIIPTRNRAELWRSGWVLDSLRAQTRPPDELVIALDHTPDDTLDVIRARALPFYTRILEVLSPRPQGDPASAIPDNCLFAAATGDILVHLDDDTALGPDFCRRAQEFLELQPRSVIWARLRFVAGDHSLLTDHPPVDYRPSMAAKRHWPASTDGIFLLPAHWCVHWGAAYAVRRTEVLAIGGHDLQLAEYRNADARLGGRLVRAGLSSYVTSKVEHAAEHLGTTHHAKTRSTGPTSGPKIANGGPQYWTSAACRQSYREIEVLDTRY